MKSAPVILRRRRIAHRLLTLALLTGAIVIFAFVVVGSTTAAGKARPGANVKVSIRDFFYDPTPITVHVGATVTWVNDGANYHSATARNHSFDTQPFAPGERRSYTFTRVGTFEYFCEVHPFMHAKVKVTN
jgi:plastocyanin